MGDQSKPRGPVHRCLHCFWLTHRGPQGFGPFHHGPRHRHPCGSVPELPSTRRMLRQLSMGIYSSQPERPGVTVDDHIHHSTPSITIAPHRNNPRLHGASGTGTRVGTNLTGRPGGAIVTEFRQPLQVQSHLEMPGILVQLGHTQRT